MVEMRYDPEIIIKINEIYHDMEEEGYQSKHEDIFKGEVQRWKEIGMRFIADEKRDLSVLDIGSGTGFVPLQIGRFLKEGDLFVCSDLSAKILAVCEKNIRKEEFRCGFRFIKLTGREIGLESGSFDCITMNSVLHHIPDFGLFFREVNRLLKKGGRLIIGHEPNRLFSANSFLWGNYKTLEFLLDPRGSAIMILKKLRLFSAVKRALSFAGKGGGHDQLIDKVNGRLIKEGIINAPLTGSEIQEMVDIHSPTAGEDNRHRGIDVYKIIEDHLPQFEIEHLDTYDHLGKMSRRNGFTGWYSRILKEKYPQSGGNFLVVMRKAG